MSTVATPRPDQRRLALEHANATRLERADLRHRIGRGELAAAEVILHPPTAAENWPVGWLLMSQRRWGVTRTRRLLAREMISELKPVGKLTDRQRRLLAEQLGPSTVGEDGRRPGGRAGPTQTPPRCPPSEP